MTTRRTLYRINDDCGNYRLLTLEEWAEDLAGFCRLIGDDPPDFDETGFDRVRQKQLLVVAGYRPEGVEL